MEQVVIEDVSLALGSSKSVSEIQSKVSSQSKNSESSISHSTARSGEGFSGKDSFLPVVLVGTS